MPKLDRWLAAAGVLIVTPLQDVASGIDRSCDFYWLRDGDQGVVLADFDGDGIPDLFLKIMSGSFGWLLRGVGDGTFTPTSAWWITQNVGSVAAADFNRDGRLSQP